MNEATIVKSAAAGAAARQAELHDFLGVSAGRPWWRRPIPIAAVVGLVLSLLLLSRCFAGDADAVYAAEPVRRGALTVTVSATGNLRPTRQVEVGSEQSGLVTDVYADNNDRVAKGQKLARLDTSRLRDAIVQNQAALEAQQAHVGQANATLVQARGSLSRLEEVHRLSGGKVPSKTELDIARAEYQRALAALRAAQAQVTQARAVLSSAQTNLGKATIYSPVTGVVLSRQIDPGQTVAASFAAPVLFTIAEDLSSMQLEVKVDEADIGQVKTGQRATFAVDAFPGRSFPATILRVDVGANASGTAAAASAGSVVSYTAILSVRNPDLILRPGMTATADIVTAQQPSQLLVPNAAFRFTPEPEGGAGKGVNILPAPPGSEKGGTKSAAIGRGSRQTIYVVGAQGEPRPVQVVTGFSDGSHTAVTGSGLRPGMKVITGRLAPQE